MTISVALQRIYNTAPDGAYYMEGISLYHSALSAPLHMTNNPVQFNGKADGIAAVFTSIPFSVTLPAKDTTGAQSLNLTFSNVQQRLVDDVARMGSKPYEPVICKYRIFIAGSVDAAGDHTEEMTPPLRLDISTFIVTEATIVAAAQKVNMHNKSFPQVRYNPTFYPGIT
jgi:hypothetical protein